MPNPQLKNHLLIAIWLWAGCALGSELPNCQVPIRFALYENGNLYSSTTDSGIDRDFALELAKRSQCPFEISVKPRARIWLELKNGQTMMTSSGIQNPERDIFAADIRYLAIKNMVVVSASAGVTNADDFYANKKLRWGVVRSFKHGAEADAFLDKLKSEDRIFEEADTDQVFKRLALGHVDAVLANHTATAAYISTFKLETKVLVQDWFTTDQPIAHGLMLSRKHFNEPEISKWRAIVRGMRLDGTLQKIFERHMGAAAAKRLMQFVPNDVAVNSLRIGSK